MSLSSFFNFESLHTLEIENMLKEKAQCTYVQVKELSTTYHNQQQVVIWLRKETILKIRIIKCIIILTAVYRSENNSMNSTLISYYNHFHFNTLFQTKVLFFTFLDMVDSMTRQPTQK